MNILLIGASGRLGTAIEHELPEHTYLTPDVTELDITKTSDIESYLEANVVDLLINCAAYNNVDGAEEAQELANNINGYAPGYLATASAKHSIPMIHFSSDYVFNGAATEPYQEGSATNPISIYGASKLLGEQEVAKNNPQHYIVRTSRLYGPVARVENAKRSFEEIVIELAQQNDTFSINEAEASAPTLVTDLARHIGEHIIDTLPEPGIYHMSNEGGCTWFEWAKAIVETKGLSSTVTPRDPNEQPRAAKRPSYSVLTSTKLPKMRGWREALTSYLS